MLKNLVSLNLAALTSLLLLPSQGFAQTATEQQCYNDVQGKVAWSQDGSRNWDDANVRALCEGALQPAKRIACFEKGILAHNDWYQAMQDCSQTGGGISTTLQPGKQCIYNTGAYVLTVEWYNPGLVTFTGGDPGDYSNYTIPGTGPIASEDITLGYSSCTNAANRAAIVRIVGHDLTNTSIQVVAGTATAAATGVAGAVACVGTAGVGCPIAVAGVSAVTGGVVAAAGEALPDVEEIAYIGVPSAQNYLDFSGTVWDVAISSTVPLNQERNYLDETGAKLEQTASTVGNSISNFVTDGTAGSKSITFNNQAGYVAGMTVMYFENRVVNGVTIPQAVVQSTGDLPAGFSRHVDIPGDAAPMPITVSITGVGTFDNDVYTTTLPASFTGNRCFKSWGTIFSTQGGSCN
jgi:hypothetical protein